MAMPSRKRLVWWIFLSFLFIFIVSILWYLSPALFGSTTYDADGNPIRTVSLFPFGDNDGFSANPLDIFNNNDDSQVEDADPNSRGNNEDRQDRLRLIDAGPVIGAYMYPSSNHSGLQGRATATTTDNSIENNFRYIELGTGHVFEGSTNSGVIDRISNTTIPRITEARFIDSEKVILRYPDENTNRIKTFSAELVRNFSDAAGTPFKIQGIFLEDNILDLSVSDQGQVAQLQESIDGLNTTAVVISDDLGENAVQVHSSPVSSWLVSWNKQEESLMMQPRPSYNVFSPAYTLNTQSGDFAPYVAARAALSVLPNDDLSQALLSVNSNGLTELYMWNREANQYIDLGLSTFAEKCTYAPARDMFYCGVPIEIIAEAEPDLWYQGVTEYTDQIWQIDAQTGQSQLILVPIEFTDDSLDMIDMSISDDEQFLYFRDKQARSLWSLQIDYERTTQALQDDPIETQVDLGDEEEFFE